MKVEIKCPNCKWEVKLEAVDVKKLKDCPVCSYAMQSESKVQSQKVLLD